MGSSPHVTIGTLGLGREKACESRGRVKFHIGSERGVPRFIPRRDGDKISLEDHIFRENSRGDRTQFIPHPFITHAKNKRGGDEKLGWTYWYMYSSRMDCPFDGKTRFKKEGEVWSINWQKGNGLRNRRPEESKRRWKSPKKRRWEILTVQ